MQKLEDLEVYKQAIAYRRQVIRTANTFPPEEKFHLTAQLKDSARSITANIAEAYGRYHFQEAIQFCRQSRGSLFETYDHLSSALDDGYITEIRFIELRIQAEHVLKLLNGYILYLKKRIAEWNQSPIN